MADRPWVVVGLGNPGPDYARTRHNVGFRVLDRLARAVGAGPETAEAGYRVAWGAWGGERLALLRPLTWMNRSGEAVLRFPESAPAGPGRHLVVLDDVSLPFGSLRLRPEGGAGGHRGLASILEALETEAVPRLRLGIGGGDPGRDLRPYVLEPFSEEEEDRIGPWLDRACDCVRALVAEGVDAAMNRFNR